MDIQSYSIWNDYIHFLRNVEATGSYAGTTKLFDFHTTFLNRLTQYNSLVLY